MKIQPLPKKAVKEKEKRPPLNRRPRVVLLIGSISHEQKSTNFAGECIEDTTTLGSTIAPKRRKGSLPGSQVLYPTARHNRRSTNERVDYSEEAGDSGETQMSL